MVTAKVRTKCKLLCSQWDSNPRPLVHEPSVLKPGNGFLGLSIWSFLSGPLQLLDVVSSVSGCKRTVLCGYMCAVNKATVTT